MAKNRNKPAVSPASGQSIPGNTLNAIPLSEEEAARKLNDALEAGDPDKILEVLDASPRWMRRQPEIMLIRAEALMAQGSELDGFKALREVEQKNPHFSAVYVPLALYYHDHDWPAQALQAAKRALAARDLPQETRTTLEQLITEATALLQSAADKLGLPLETMQRASSFHERAQMVMDENLSGAESLSKEAIKIAPGWNPPRNNRAQALYFLGRIPEAIAVSEEVLARDAENVFALGSLATFYYGLDQPEKAREYASRLSQLAKAFPADSLEIEQAISALAVVGDTAELWDIAKRCLALPGDTFYARTWTCLAVAAIRSEKWKDALKLIEKIDKEERTPAMTKLLEELRKVNPRHPRLAWMPPAYPGADMLLRSSIIAEWEGLSKNFSGDLSASQKRQVVAFIQKYPYILVALKRLLWDEASSEFASQFLALLENPEADAEILRFAFSQSGSKQARFQAIMELAQRQRYSGPKIARVWDETDEDWRTVELNLQKVGPIEYNIRPQTLALMEKAHQAKDPQDAIAFLRQAVEHDPASPNALFNLGVSLTQYGNVEEGDALIWRSVEVDPNYTYGHASIALTEAGRGHEQEALDHLEVVTHAAVISPETAAITSLAWADLALQKHDLKTARQHLETAAQFAPDSRLVEDFQKILAEEEEYQKKFGFLINFQRDSARRSHQKLLDTPLSPETSLSACLDTCTKEMLAACAHFWRVTSSGKKGELVSRLASALTDAEFLRPVLATELTEKERSALAWLLEANGIQPWLEFTRRYGTDLEESTYWQENEPQSIPGRLRRLGIFFTGTLESQQVAFLPAEMRPILHKILG